MSIYAIGDLHLSMDERIEKPMDIFGARWKEHDKKLEENWRAVVGDEDTVIIPGDISCVLVLCLPVQLLWHRHCHKHQPACYKCLLGT